MAAKPPDISEYLRTQGFGPRELATLEVADSAAVAGQLSFELNIPRSGELAKTVEDLIGTASAPARPWLVVQPIQGQDEDRPPPGEKIRKLLASGDERAARELRLQVLWTRQLGEELVAMGPGGQNDRSLPRPREGL